MSGQDTKIARRKFVKLAGAAAMTVPLAGLTACGGDSKEAASSAPAPKKPAAKPAASTPEPKPAQAAAPAPKPAPAPAATTANLVKLEESDPLAQSLGYKHNAADIDTAKFPKRGTPEAANQYCRNCVLFSGGDEDWGPCSIFAGKKVSANGWCATYAARG